MTTQEFAESRGEAEKGAGVAYLYMVSLVAAVGGFLFGYDLSLISGAIIYLKTEFALTPGLIGVVVGSAILGCPFGPVAGMWVADKMGRKRTLVIAGVLFIISGLGCALAHHLIVFIFWRFIGGIGVGLASTVSPMYIAEIAPARLRGRLVMVFQLSVGIGLSMSVYVAYLLSFGGHWRWMFATQTAPAVALLLGLAIVPESPRWLAAVNRMAESLAILTKINGKAQADREMAEIRDELSQESGGFHELLLPGMKLALLIGIGLMVFSQVDGANMIVLYTPSLLQAAGLTSASDAILNSVYICGWIIFCTLIAFWIIRKFSRRGILICGALGIVAGHVLMFLNFSHHYPIYFTLLAMAVPVGSYVVSLGPLSWVVISEMFPNRVRAKAMCISTCSMFAASFITTYLFPIVTDDFKARFGQPGGIFLVFAVICLGGCAFVWKWLPETKNRTLEEIGMFWLKLDRDRGEK